MKADVASAEQRVLVLVPTVRDAALSQAVLQREGVACLCCQSLAQLCSHLTEGAATVLLMEEAIEQDREGLLQSWLRNQPRWSDLPILVLARYGAASSAVMRAMDHLGNVTVMERPIRISALVSAVRVALRARNRQYQTRKFLDEIEETTQALRESDHRKDVFLATLSHELRNPLAPIRNSLELLKQHGADDPMARQARDIMDRQLTHLVRLVDDLLDVSRISFDKLELHRAPTEFASIIRQAVETCRPMVSAAQMELDVRLPLTPAVVDADPLRMAQVISNLLNNACKYSSPGGTISLIVEVCDREVVVTVRDQGMGIPRDKIGTVFNMFTQGPDAQQGLGIGLSLVKRLTEMHGGRVEAFSDGPGKGSAFVIRLPRCNDVAVVRSENASRPQPPARSRRILVVDDNRDSAASLTKLLALTGHQTQMAYDGPEAIEATLSFVPDVVLLDIGLPTMDGFDVCRAIRGHPVGRDMVVIALSGWGQPEDRRKSIEAGFNAHLVKPVEYDALMTTLAGAHSMSA